MAAVNSAALNLGREMPFGTPDSNPQAVYSAIGLLGHTVKLYL